MQTSRGGWFSDLRNQGAKATSQHGCIQGPTKICSLSGEAWNLQFLLQVLGRSKFVGGSKVQTSADGRHEILIWIGDVISMIRRSCLNYCHGILA